MIRALAFLVVAWAISATALAEAQRVPLEVGQVWTIKNAPVPETRLLIAVIEPYGTKESSVHVSLTGVGLGRLPDGGLFGGSMLHVPFEHGALETSLDQLVATGQIPRPEIHYAHQSWKQNQGGLFRVGAAEAIRTLLETNQITPMPRK